MERCNDVRRSFVLGDGPACRRRPVTPALPITRDREFAPPGQLPHENNYRGRLSSGYG